MVCFQALIFETMNGILSLGKYLFAFPMAIFGIFHFMVADQMAGMAPGGAPMVYFTGAALIAAAVSITLAKMDKLAATLLGIMLLLFIIPHAQSIGVDDATAQASGFADATSAQTNHIMSILKNIAMAGASFVYAGSASKDKSGIG